jgi:thioredoxin 1
MIPTVTDLNFREVVLSSSVPVLVNFEAPWCGLCKVITPITIQFHDRWKERVNLVNVNADENFKLATAYRLKVLPTSILFVDGQIVQRLEGFRGHEDFHASLDRIAVIITAHWGGVDRGNSYMGADSRLVMSE